MGRGATKRKEEGKLGFTSVTNKRGWVGAEQDVSILKGGQTKL